ncbi:uncharacterized protein OCT59_006203 [Rhizophagus irregularis]|uniref:Uncharacterized protein n=1 Tax=Rhizophagus irregularis (strain DAOM 181602 / DAOM 197198 / MUCL 43194) TaxID=747089 RepID=A0A2P4PSF9_RHIID|nr:hypothetical protein GLOIN_2v1638887 [Rhizophagus irregularis DAOM 181602=DAOM 197198]POG68324.1 hypothetical protein GLOIN_2v1638887 [Rhizophagus irregularis DAOM 181602=DAOM 197198]UZO14758.1 hypothetical protein OCT59_006203 [Rhizophagus irregularis]|eukprot:XP_025175190.1 hypothetical protein GLOIN_2v1638887 [Rhizophagus irregularis DAOM 181602=DAOM 197198]
MWLESYIAFNSKLRQLLQSSLIILSMARLENMRKYQDTRLLPLRNRKNEKSLLNKIRNPSFKYAHLLGKDFNWRPHGKGWICLKKLIPSTIHIVQLPDEQWINNKNEKPILKNTKVIGLNEIPVFLRQRAARILDDLIVIINWRSPWSHGGAGQIKRSL